MDSERVVEDFEEFYQEELASASSEQRARMDAFARFYERGAEVARARHAHGWSQSELAAKAGIDQADLSRIERGQGNPTDRTWNRLADALGMRWESHLVNREDPLLV